MHMADALLSPAVGLGMDAASVGLAAWAARRFVREERHQETIPLAGVLGAFVFGAQMLNFSIPGTGSSGHIGGGLLLAMMLGPWAGFLTIAAVLIIQCLFFADGGLLALGCNVFNLGFWPCFVGLPLYRFLAGRETSPRRQTLAAVTAAVCSLQLGAFGVTVETLLSGRTELPFAAFAPVMAGIHLPIGLVEGIMTAAILRFVARTRPEILANAKIRADTTASTPWRPVIAGFALAALFCAGVAAWFASTHPDGLEWSIGRISGKEELSAQNGLAATLGHVQKKTAFFPDYGFRKTEPDAAAPSAPGVEAAPNWPAVDTGTSVAGVLGAILTAGMVVGVTGILFLFQRHLVARRGQTRSE